MIVNNLPAPTWRWLRMNAAEVDALPEYKEYKYEVTCPEGVSRSEKAAFDTDCRTGLGEEAKELFKASGAKVEQFSVASGKEVAEPIRLGYKYEDKAADVSGTEIVLEEGSSVTCVMTFSSDRKASGDAYSSFRYDVKAGAHLTLIQVQMLGDDFRFFNDIGGAVAEKGEFSLYQVILSGKESYYGSFTSLPERKGSLKTDIAYLLKDSELLDMNYVADHTGRKTECDINVAGVLRGTSKKIFRGTIDFHRGCAGSVGSEMEEVLLMDEGVINQTIPLILCDEEDVEGNHGATLGRIDENVLFYLRSRGIPDEEIYEMMARAKIDRICGKINDTQTVEAVQEYLK